MDVIYFVKCIVLGHLVVHALNSIQVQNPVMSLDSSVCIANPYVLDGLVIKTR